MSEKERSGQTDDFFIPTPEELDVGVFSGRPRRSSERKDTDPERLRRRRGGWLSSQVRRGVGQRRTEVQVPRQVTPPSTGTPRSGGQSDLRGGYSAGTNTVSRKRKSPPVPQGRSTSEKRSSRKLRGVSSPSRSVRPSADRRRTAQPKVGEQQVRKISVPTRRPRDVPAGERDPVPGWLTEGPRKLGHRLSIFKPRPRLDPQEQLYVASCSNCGQRAFARRVAPHGFPLSENGRWEPLTGTATERTCSS